MKKMTTAAKDLVAGLLIDEEYEEYKHRDLLIVKVENGVDVNTGGDVVFVETVTKTEDGTPITKVETYYPETELLAEDFLYKLRILEKSNELQEKTIHKFSDTVRNHHEQAAKVELGLKKIRDNHYNIKLETVFNQIEETVFVGCKFFGCA